MAALALPVLAIAATGCTVSRLDSMGGNATAAPEGSRGANPPKSELDAESFRKTAVTACTDSAARDGVRPEVSQGYCNCAINGLLTDLSSQQIADIVASGTTRLPPDVEDRLSQYVLDCIDSLVSG